MDNGLPKVVVVVVVVVIAVQHDDNDNNDGICYRDGILPHSQPDRIASLVFLRRVRR